MELSVEVLRFDVRVGELVAPQQVLVTESHGIEQPWQASADAGWVVIDPDHGVGDTAIQVSVVTRGIEPGSYQATVTFLPISDQPEALRAFLIVELNIQAPGWTSLDGPYGGDITAVTVDPQDSDRIWAGSSTGILYRSTDGGASFNTVPIEGGAAQSITSIQIQPSGRAYLAMKDASFGGVYRSNDRGNSWTPTALQNVAVTSLALHDDDLVLAEGDGLWRTTDGGANWDLVTVDEGSHFVARDPARSGGFLVGGNEGVVNLTDGFSFTPISTGRTESIVGFTALEDGSWYLMPSIPYYSLLVLLVSRDNGTSWQEISGAGLPAGIYNYSYKFGSDRQLLWTMVGTAHLSRDAGDTFSLVAKNYRPYSDSSQFVAVAPHPQGTLFAHRSEGILQHVDGVGIEKKGIMANTVRDLEWDPTSAQLFGIVSPGGVFRMTSDGIMEGLGGSGLDCEIFFAISVDPQSSMNILVGTRYCSSIYRTVDGGNQWTGSAPGITPLYHVYDISRAPDDPAVVWLATTHGLFYSLDSGLSYTQVTEDDISQVAAISSNAALFNAGGISRHDISTSRVEVIHPLGNSPTLLSRTQDGSIWYGHRSYELHRSTDDGQTFNPVGFGGHDPLCVAVDPDSPDRIYVGFQDGLFESRDNGESWQESGAPFPVRSLAYDSDNDHLYVGTIGGGVYRYLPPID